MLFGDSITQEAQYPTGWGVHLQVSVVYFGLLLLSNDDVVANTLETLPSPC